MLESGPWGLLAHPEAHRPCKDSVTAAPDSSRAPGQLYGHHSHPTAPRGPAWNALPSRHWPPGAIPRPCPPSQGTPSQRLFQVPSRADCLTALPDCELPESPFCSGWLCPQPQPLRAEGGACRRQQQAGIPSACPAGMAPRRVGVASRCWSATRCPGWAGPAPGGPGASASRSAGCSDGCSCAAISGCCHCPYSLQTSRRSPWHGRDSARGSQIAPSQAGDFKGPPPGQHALPQACSHSRGQGLGGQGLVRG